MHPHEPAGRDRPLRACRGRHARAGRLTAVRLIACPFHDGRLEHDRGAGPAAIAPDAAAVPAPDPGLPEAARVFAVAASVAEAVRSARSAGKLPVVLAGDCNSAVGTVAGCGPEPLGVVWLDAHADADTPATSRGGSLDAMGLALLLGHGWDALRATVPGLEAVPAERIVTGGIRDTERHQDALLDSSGVSRVRDVADLPSALDALATRVDRVYLHVDLDVLDPAEGRANRYAAPGGWTTAELHGAVTATRDRFSLAAVALTAYEPAADPDGRVAAVARDVLRTLA